MGVLTSAVSRTAASQTESWERGERIVTPPMSSSGGVCIIVSSSLTVLIFTCSNIFMWFYLCMQQAWVKYLIVLDSIIFKLY